MIDNIFQIEDKNHLKLSTPIPLTNHPAAVYLDSLSDSSRYTMRKSLNQIASILTDGECDADTLNWALLRYQHTSAVRSVLMERYAPATINKMLCALRGVLSNARKLGLIQFEDYEKAVALDDVRGDSPPRGRALSSAEIQALMDSCKNNSPRDLRDGAIIAILRGSGIRRAELVSLKYEDFEADTNTIYIHQGKGKKNRNVYLPASATDFVSKWIVFRGDRPGALLCPVNKGGNIEFRHMTSDAILKILRKRGKQVGIDSFSPHDFRRTFCSDLLDAGVDLVTVQKLAGHSSIMTTSKYDRRGEETKKAAVQHLVF